jgi:adenylate cyclase
MLGRADQPVRKAVRRAQLLITFSLIGANLVGAVGAFVLAAYALPSPVLDQDDHVLLVNLVAASIYVLVTGVLSTLWGIFGSRRRVRWLLEGRVPTKGEQRRTLRLPALMVNITLLFWSIAAVGFGLYNSFTSIGLGISIAAAIALAGTFTAADAYFLSEFALRPVTARALAAGSPGRLLMPGLRTRTLVAWALGSAVPVALLLAVAIEDLSGGTVSRDRLSLTILTVGGAALVFGWFFIRLATRATADPIRGLRAAIAKVEAGDLDVQIPIYDASQVGLLQMGFNQMVDGLRERERIRDLFGRQVGEEAATVALSLGLDLAGELREVSVLFVDIVGSTTLAATRPPHEVVDLLNRFFAVVVEVVAEHGGWINKFQGDATLAVFGAPSAHEHPERAALAAARDLRAQLLVRVPDCEVGIGVASGPAVVGHVGTPERYEYTVVGDCVNEAARLSTLAKLLPERVAASSVAVQRGDVLDEWSKVDDVVLRGRENATTVMAPLDL